MVTESLPKKDDFAHELFDELDLEPLELQYTYVDAKGKLEIDSLIRLRLQLEQTSQQIEPIVREEQNRAREIAKKIPVLARQAAAAGRRYVGIMKLVAEDFTSIPEYTDTLDPEFLVQSRAPYFLYNLCLEKGLDPQIRPWHEIEGYRSGLEFYINW